MQSLYKFFIALSIVFLLTACTPGEPQTPEAISTPTETPTPVETEVPTPTFELIAEPTSTPSPTDEVTPTAIPVTALIGTNLQFWHTSTSGKEQALLSLVNEFNSSNTYGIEVTAVSHGSELYMDVRDGIPLGNIPHVAVAFNNQIQSWANYGNLIVDLDEYIYDPEWGFSDDEIADFYPTIWEQDVVNGRRLGLPFYRSATVLFYNQTWAQELGFDSPPTTPDEFKQQACAAAAANNNGTGGWIITSDIGSLAGWLFAFGGEFVNLDETGYTLNTSEAESAFSFLKGMQEEGCAWLPGVQYPNQEFATRFGLFLASSVAGIPFQQRAFEYANNRDQWMVLPFPGEDGDPVIDVYGSSYAIFTTTPSEQLAAWIFIKWMAQPQNQAVWVAASDYLPSRSSTLDFLDEYLDENPHYTSAEALLTYARYEPSFGSWGVARWAIGDYTEQLFSPEFTSEEIPVMLEELNATLAEIQLNYR